MAENMSVRTEMTERGLDDEQDTLSQPQYIMLQSKDKTDITVLREYALISGLVKAAVDDKHATVIPIPIASTELLQIVVKYMNSHKGVSPAEIAKPLRSADMKNLTSNVEDIELVTTLANTNRQALYDLTLVANYMDIKPLLNLACAKIATMMKGTFFEFCYSYLVFVNLYSIIFIV